MNLDKSTHLEQTENAHIFNWSLFSGMNIVKLGWRCGKLCFFQPSKCRNTHFYPQIWSIWPIFPNDSESLPKVCYINWKNSEILSKLRISEPVEVSDPTSQFLQDGFLLLFCPKNASPLRKSQNCSSQKTTKKEKGFSTRTVGTVQNSN